jgi:uncharacterized protein YcfL
MKEALILLLAAISIAGCSGSEERNAESSLSRSRRDSVLSESKIPGAGAVKRSIDISDSASARSERIDRYSKQRK